MHFAAVQSGGVRTKFTEARAGGQVEAACSRLFGFSSRRHLSLGGSLRDHFVGYSPQAGRTLNVRGRRWLRWLAVPLTLLQVPPTLLQVPPILLQTPPFKPATLLLPILTPAKDTRTKNTKLSTTKCYFNNSNPRKPFKKHVNCDNTISNTISFRFGSKIVYVGCTSFRRRP